MLAEKPAQFFTEQPQVLLDNPVPVGTAFLTTHESGISPIDKRGLLKAAESERSTVTCLKRLFSDKLARGLVNKYLTAYAEYEHSRLQPYPRLNAMTKRMRNIAAKQDYSD